LVNDLLLLPHKTCNRAVAPWNSHGENLAGGIPVSFKNTRFPEYLIGDEPASPSQGGIQMETIPEFTQLLRNFEVIL